MSSPPNQRTSLGTSFIAHDSPLSTSNQQVNHASHLELVLCLPSWSIAGNMLTFRHYLSAHPLHEPPLRPQLLRRKCPAIPNNLLPLARLPKPQRSQPKSPLNSSSFSNKLPSVMAHSTDALLRQQLHSTRRPHNRMRPRVFVSMARGLLKPSSTLIQHSTMTRGHDNGK